MVGLFCIACWGTSIVNLLSGLFHCAQVQVYNLTIRQFGALQSIAPNMHQMGYRWADLQLFMPPNKRPSLTLHSSSSASPSQWTSFV